MNHNVISVFIYGSLLPGQANHHVVSNRMIAARPGRIVGRLVDVGAYPALIRDESAFREERYVRGMWIDVTESGLQGMDQLEDFGGIEESNDYDRIWTADADCSEQCGWVYIWDSPRGCPPIMEQYWPEFCKNRMAAE
ncbi:gamma-glutamylcyclotransferase [Paenibacillus oenotherae]|uniref:Gamma-glutamylcyclotransferase n=1 Tax=Paenibacillus oenotherae TaxID=1435645 RepID=A0ABS7D4M6_9BACL|nr:gamma-glutamylcyclotransferase family protein [Paenibacillus oenotherae]MBW7474441.1 gamma-glutamylcyclotransferase [Paenibacillus oenotherae]